jgi:3-oxoacyl-[acyl-carrier protein] reductase
MTTDTRISTRDTRPRTAVRFLIYTTTKGALETITQVLAKELGRRGIRVYAINPGVVAGWAV